MRNIAFGFACRIVCWTLLAPAVHAGELTIGNLLITQAWSRATPGGTPGGTPVAGGYLTIENKGSLPDRLPVPDNPGTTTSLGPLGDATLSRPYRVRDDFRQTRPLLISK